MTNFHFTITPETAVQLQAEREELERQMAKLREQHQLVLKKIEAIPLFLPALNGNGAPANGNAIITPQTGRLAIDEKAPLVSAVPSPQPPPEIPAEESVPMAVKLSLQKHGRMTSLEIRNALLNRGVPRERFGATFSYLYTVLGRLVASGQIQRQRGKYQLPPGVTIQEPNETKSENLKS